MNLRRLWPFGRRLPPGEAGLAQALDELADRMLRNERIDWNDLHRQLPEQVDELSRLSEAVGILTELGAPERRP